MIKIFTTFLIFFMMCYLGAAVINGTFDMTVWSGTARGLTIAFTCMGTLFTTLLNYLNN